MTSSPVPGRDKRGPEVHSLQGSHQGFHGWKILALCTFCQFVSMGFTLYLLGVFIEPFAEMFNASPGQIGAASAVFAVTGAILSPVLGYWADKGKTRLLMLIGAAAMALGFVLLSQAQSLFHAAAVCILFIAPATALLGTITTTVMVAKWFARRRGFAIGVSVAGISLGGFLMPPVSAMLLANFGAANSLLILAGLVGLVLLPAIWLVGVESPATIGQHPDGKLPSDMAEGDASTADTGMSYKALLRRSDFWVVTLCVGCISFAGLLIVTYLAPFARATGISLQNSAFIMSMYAISGIAGKFTTGWLSDTFEPRRIMTATLVMAAIGWLPVLLMEGPVAFGITACAVGFAMGGLIPVWSSIIALNFGLHNFGKVRGIMSFMIVGFTMVPGPLAGYLYDTTGSYTSAFAILWWSLPIGVVASLLIKRPPAGAAL